MDDDNDDHNDDEIKDENQVWAWACLVDRSRTGLVISGPHSSSSQSSIFFSSDRSSYSVNVLL